MTKRRTLTVVSCTLMAGFLIVLVSKHSGVIETRPNIQRQYETKAPAEITDWARHQDEHGLIVNDIQRQYETKVAAEIRDWARFQDEHGLIVNESRVNLYVEPIRIKNTFTNEERLRIEQCQESPVEDRKKSMAMFSKDRKAPVLHHNYLKNNDTVVIEIGGNVGKIASQMMELYNHRHVILEPLPSLAIRLRERFKNYTRIAVLNIGLGKKSETIYVKAAGVGTSIFSKKSGDIPIYVMNSTEFFMRIGVGVFSVDLLFINCEGCEFDVIENLVSTHMTIYFKNIQFQPHGHLKTLNNEDWVKRYCMIQETLSRTHRLTFQYRHIWENWRRLDL